MILVRFETVVGKDEAIQDGIYHFDNKPFIVKAWNPDMKLTRDELYTVPILIRFPRLVIKYWSPQTLSKIGSLVGKPMMVDNNTEKKNGLNFARLLVEVEMDTKLPELVVFKNEKGQVVEQKVMYDWKPTLCTHCHKYGHVVDICRKKKMAANGGDISKGRNAKRGIQHKDRTSNEQGIQEEQIQETTINSHENQTQVTTAKQNDETVWVTPQKAGKSKNIEVQQAYKQIENSNSFQVLEGSWGNTNNNKRLNLSGQVGNVGTESIPYYGDG
ncbi:hypothetical protein KY284_023283 [Solanum tuberosum]|nr:hypothetical protein KY284_023283 [Solanum tuberosum]